MSITAEKNNNKVYQLVDMNQRSYQTCLFLTFLRSPKPNLIQQPTTESTEMTAWWYLQEIEMKRKLSIVFKSFSKQWTRQRETNTYNSPCKYGQQRGNPPPLRRKI